jgi:hypothetical protein
MIIFSLFIIFIFKIIYFIYNNNINLFNNNNNNNNNFDLNNNNNNNNKNNENNNNNNNFIFLPQLIYLNIILIFLYNLIKFKNIKPKIFIINFLIWLLMINNIENSFLIILIHFQNTILIDFFLDFQIFDFFIILFWSSQCSYFSFGNSISISTIDISKVYLGIFIKI